MTILNGLPRSWDSFIQRICARRKLVTFNRMWEECSQEEARIVAREEKMGSEDQSLTIHSKKIGRDYHHPKGKHSHQKDNPKIYSRDMSKIRCYTCDEKRNYDRECPRNKNTLTRRGETREHIMLMLQKMMNLPQKELDKKVMILQVMKNMFWFSFSRELSHMEVVKTTFETVDLEARQSLRTVPSL